MNSRPSNRPPRGQSSRGRGGRPMSGPDYKPVPTIQQVRPAYPVSIILKQDQQTGHEVQGIVAELLTRGNHPRGIKVRLRDGRVGRVQRMVRQETAEAGAAGLEGLGRNGEVGGGESAGRVQVMSEGRLTGRRYGDYRVEAPDEPEESNLSLAGYVVVKEKKKGKAKKTVQEEQDEYLEDEQAGDAPAVKTATRTCPVCGDFEGDGAAVAHHVNEHFD